MPVLLQFILSMSKLAGLALIGLFVTGLGLMGLLGEAPFWLSNQTSSTGSRYISVLVERGEVHQVVSATGTLNALVTVQVGTQLSGQISQIFADFNDSVRKGQTLAQLDRKSFEARLAEARASTAMSEAAVAVQKARMERSRIDSLDAVSQRVALSARVDNARAQQAAAEAAFRRVETLRQRGTTSSSQLEQAQATRDSAMANLREAEANGAVHEHKVQGAKVDFARAQAELDSALAQLAQQRAIERSMEIDVERTTIRSPVDGVVIGRNVTEGQTVAASLESPILFTIAGDLQQMEIHARVDESDIGRIRVDQKANFTVDAYPEQQFVAAVTGIRKSPQVVQNVVTYTVVLATTNRESLLLPGMTATVQITIAEATDILRIPMTALRFSPSGGVRYDSPMPAEIDQGKPATIWVLDESGGLAPASVGIGETDGTYAMVLAGALKEKDQVVVGEAEEIAQPKLFGFRFGF